MGIYNELDVIIKEHKQETKQEDSFDVWVYPDQIDRDIVLNVFSDEGTMGINVYHLPSNWRNLCESGSSIHDIMELIS